MPPTNLSPEVAPKKPTKNQTKDTEWKKPLLRDCDSKSIDSTNRSIQGAGEALATPKPIKPKKPREKKPADTLPKKNAQRAKGSISLNKTIEQLEAEPKAERRCQVSAEKLVKADSTEKSPEDAKTPMQKRKKKATASPREAGEKPEKKTPPKRKPCVVKEPSGESIEEKTLEVVNQEPVEAKSEEIRAVATGFNSCSFFEKIQQGVKAYFSSRSSFNPDDGNKKEGGIQTRGRVGKGGEEEVEKSEPGIKIKNKNPDTVLLCDQLRYMGGRSSNSLSTKPKLLRHFRKMKRKKLYHPKKCYVRIQIPRKGYFYRSTVRLQSPEYASQPRAKTKVAPGSQISGLAPARPKAASLRNKAGLNKQEAPPAAHPLETHPCDPFAPDDMERLLSEFRGRESPVNFEDEVKEYVALNWPDVDGEVSFEDALLHFQHFQPEGKRQISAISTSFNEGDAESEIRCTEGGSSWEGLVDCLNSTLPKDPIIYNLEIMRMIGGATPFTETVLQSIQEEQETAEPEQKQSETFTCSSDSSDFSPDEMTAFLMGGVDLHMELQNYLNDFQTAKSKTKTILPCNFYDNYVPLKLYSSGKDQQKRAEEYSDVIENRSGTSFDSATSDCLQLEEVTNEMLLDLTAATEPDPTPRRATKADPGEQQQQQQTLENSIKRTTGITPFQMFRLDGKTTWGLSYLQSEGVNHTGGRLHDDYEKIQPLGADVARRKIKTGWLFQNPVTQSEQPPEGGKSSAPQPEQIPSWSPTLQELIDIYNSVLKQNTKIRQKSKQPVHRCISTHLFNFLNEKLREKHYKADLLNLSKDLKIDCKTLKKLGNPIKGTNDLMKLEEYVEMFQEILHSSLSINQITRLNNTLAGLQDYSEKNYNYVKDLKVEAKKKPKEPTPEPVKEPVPPPKVQARPKTAPKKPKKTVRFETPPKPVRPAQKTGERKIRRQLKPRKPKAKPKLVTPPVKEKIEKTKLSAPAELEYILKLCSKGIVLEKQDMSEEKRKILVTVKLHGNHVLVNGISRFNNESALVSEKPESKGTSELIIENVTLGKMSSDVWWKNTKSSRLRIQNQENTRKPLKRPKKTTKAWKQQKLHKSVRRDAKSSEQAKTKQQFEYDQVQLRAQHPIDAIAELSESKVSQQVESSEEPLKGEPPPETKILLQDIPATPKAMKEALKAVLEQKVCSKDLGCDFGWSEENLPKKVTQKRSPRSKRRSAPKNSKHAVAVRSLVDLENQAPTKTKGPKAPTYLCYSSVQSPQAGRKTPRKTIRGGSPAKSKPKRKEVSKKVSKEKQVSAVKAESPPPEPRSTASDVQLHSPVNESTHSGEADLSFADARPTSRESQTPASLDSGASLAKEEPVSPPWESSVALLQASPCNDSVSIVHHMNHSDSFLENISPQGVSHTKLRSLFKCSSELKFYPGRLTESETAQEKPILTFVLTPSQHEQAQLSENQVKVVKREGSKTSGADDKENVDISDVDTEEDRDEISLRSIEEFINYLSECRKAAKINTKKRSKLETVEKKLESARYGAKNKTPAPTGGPPSRRVSHNCQKMTPLQGNKKRAEKPGAETVSPTKQKPKNKKTMKSSDVFLNKVVENLTRALESLQNEKLMKKKESQKGKTANPSETNTEPKEDNKTVESDKPVEIPKEVVEAIKKGITQAGGLEETQETTAEIGDGMCKATQNEGTSCEEAPKKVKAVKIKIHCNETKRPTESGEAAHPPPQEQQMQHVGEIELLDSLVSRDTQGGDLKRQNSTYFDAIEKDLDVNMGGDTNSTNPPTTEGTLDLNVEFGVKEQPKHTLFTPSQERLLSRDALEKNSKEVIYNKIAKAFQEGEVTHSTALLEAFLSRTEDSDSVRLGKLLELVENRSKSIMMNMERAAWQKVLSLMEEVTQVLRKDDAQSSNSQMETTKYFIDKIQPLKSKRLVDLQTFCSSFLTPPPEVDTQANVIDRIKQSLQALKQKFTLKRSTPSRDLDNLDRSELSESGSGFKIHSTVSLPEIREDKLTKRGNKQTDSQELKKKLQQQYFYMQELLKAGETREESENMPQEIQEVKERVVEKIKMLERSFKDKCAEDTLRESTSYWNKAASLLKLATGCRTEEGSSATTGEVRLDRRRGYVDLVKCLMKAWDTKMTIGSIKGECVG